MLAIRLAIDDVTTLYSRLLAILLTMLLGLLSFRQWQSQNFYEAWASLSLSAQSRIKIRYSDIQHIKYLQTFEEAQVKMQTYGSHTNANIW